MALAFGTLGLCPNPAPAFQCEITPDPDATRIMREIELAARGLPRILRMSIVTHYTRKGRPTRTGSEPTPQTLWGVVDGGSEETWTLYVFSGPGRMAGTALLWRDAMGGSQRDANWFYLRAFERFERIQGAVERVTIPATALTYEDARGYIAGDRYHFAFSQQDDGPSQATRRIRACPRTPDIAAKLGYSALELEVEPGLQLVRSVDYRGPGGGRLKTFRVKETAALGKRHFPKTLVIEDTAEGFRNEIEYEYWSPVQALPREIFSPDIVGGKTAKASGSASASNGEEAPPNRSVLARLQRLLRDNGLGERIDREVAAAESVVRALEKRRASQLP